MYLTNDDFFKYIYFYLILTCSWSSLGIPWFSNKKTAQLFGYLQSVQQRIPAIRTTKDKKIRTFLTQKVFSPNAFDILPGKVNCKSVQN